MNRLPNRSTRPALEALENRAVPTYLAAALPGMGVWRYSPPGIWEQVTAANATQVAADSRGDVIGTFPGQGVWLCTPGNLWKQLTARTAAGLDITYRPIQSWVGTIGVVAEFPGQGLWRWGLIIGNYGVWNPIVDGGWIQLTANNAAAEAIDQNGTVAAAFPGWGVWRFHDSTGWQQLTAAAAVAVGVDPSGDVAAAFTGWGVWGFGDPAGAAAHHWAVGWNHLTWADAGEVAIDAGSVYGMFPGSGVWWYGGSTWTDLRIGNASSLGVGA